MNRLRHLPTLRIRPEDEISIHFRGKIYKGVAGDTIATLLFANGIRIFSRSLKYHRPRGLYSLEGECSNTFMQVDGIPNVCTEKTLARSGMIVKAQNVVGSPEYDLMGFMDKLSWTMPAGFYYWLFHKPAAIWPLAIKQIRKAAGIGNLSPSFEMKGRYDENYLNADVCIIGGGPAGMCAALAASEHDLRVILLESRPWLGGFFDYRSADYTEDLALYERARALANQVEQTSSVRVFKHTSMIGAYNNNLITAFQQGTENDNFTERYIEIRAESVVVATGCIERPLLFENNEKPGVMQVACAHRLARTHGLMVGMAAVFSIGHDLGLEAAIDLHDLGLNVLCVADVRENGQESKLIAKLQERKIPILKGWVAEKAHGGKCLNGVTLTKIAETQKQKFNCDTLVASAGLTPLTGPLALAGATLAYDDHTGFFLPDKLPNKIYTAGRMLGLSDAFAIETSGELAGLRAAADCGTSLKHEIDAAEKELHALPGPVKGSQFVTATRGGKKTFVCFDEDTTLKHINQALELGFDGPELIKRFTSGGTGPGQGGIPGHNLPLYVRQLQDADNKTVKPTNVRPPLASTFLATYAGGGHVMSKHTPVHSSQVKAGGKMERIGVWYRARRFSEDKSAREEIVNVRNNVGLLDASSLGKFRIHGPDALNALQRVYVGDMSKMAPGKVKYTAMCNEDGCIIDDGVVIQDGKNDYYFTTSTNRAGKTVEWIRYHTRYDGWDFHLINLTDAFGVINLAGPNARKVLQKITDADISNDVFPFTGCQELMIESTIPVRAMRLGFVGELSYELHVSSSFMQAVWDLLKENGEEFGIMNFGLEAQNCLRMEKGHLIIGSESEQRTTLHDVGLGHLWFQQKPEAKTVGAFALKETETQKGRLKLVGIKMDDSSRTPKEGSIIVDEKIRGYVCTARYSNSVAESIGMALVEDHLSIPGTHLKIFEDNLGDQRLSATVVTMPFYDPEGKRMKI
ncbi:MAG: (2Fe-2S)-binding protein [Desulfobacterales bacterium]|nr:MAG: (2Fe-2S)-binding protein [Desulfobacterales bacterium]